MRTPARGRTAITLIKDLGSFILAWALIFQQAVLVPPGQANVAFLWLAGALLGVPGASTLLTSFRPGTTSRGSSPRRPVSPH